jgi:hypothetical protein
MSETLTPADMAAPSAPVVADTPAPESQTTETVEAQPEPAPKPTHEPWYQQRIRQQAARVAAETSRAERVERELEVTRAALARYEAQQRGQQTQDNVPGQPQPAPPVGLTERDVEARAATIAAQRADAASFNAQSNAVFESGTASYPDFAAKLAQFDNLGGLGSHIEFVKDVITLPNAPQVLYALASDLDHAAHVLALPARQQAMALATLSNHLAGSAHAATPAAPAAIPTVTASKAPPPIKPIAGKAAQGPADIYDKNISMEQFIKMRLKK